MSTLSRPQLNTIPGRMIYSINMGFGSDYHEICFNSEEEAKRVLEFIDHAFDAGRQMKAYEIRKVLGL